MRINLLLTGIMLAAALGCLASASFVGSAIINAPAVIISNNTGSLTRISLTVTTGTGNVTFTDRSAVASSTYDSALLAANYGAYYSGKNFSNYNFIYTINDSGNNVSGPSAGAAMTLLAVSALENKPLGSGFTITGTINPDGSIGQIGGSIDKTGAAARAGLRFILVPWVPPGSIEQGIYYIAQNEYGIPLIEVVNISQAAGYAFGSVPVPKGVSINLSSNYRVGGLPSSQLSCSNSCNMSPFLALTNHTIGLAHAQVQNLSSDSGFRAVAGQLMNTTSQAAAIGGKGYLYISADIAFLGYLDAFYLGSYNTTRYGALDYMQNVQTGCSNLIAPPLTSSNYEYVIGGELRQGWANFTINSTIGGFNVTGSIEDDVVSAMYSAAQAEAWCEAASLLYGYQYQSGGDVQFSQSLGQLANQRLDRAAPYPGMYLTLAREAYRAGDYPVAILDADYAYALTYSSQPTSLNASELDSRAAAIAASSNYGAWATQFSREALFYVYESGSAKNSSQAEVYAEQAYSSAFLAQQMSNDTLAIFNSLSAGQQPEGAPAGQNSAGQANTNLELASLSIQVRQLTEIIAVMFALLVGCVAFLMILGHRLMALSARQKRGRRRKAR
jgi:hypothetical protein